MKEIRKDKEKKLTQIAKINKQDFSSVF